MSVSDTEFAVQTIVEVMEGVVWRSAQAATARDGQPHADVTGFEDRQAEAVVDAIRSNPALAAALGAHAAVIEPLTLDTIVRLTKERDLAREDCGAEKALKVSIKGELMVFIRLRQEALDLVAERDATIEELQQNCDRIRRKADLFSADLAERDATIAKVRALVADPNAALVVDRIRAELDAPTELVVDLVRCQVCDATEVTS